MRSFGAITVVERLKVTSICALRHPYRARQNAVQDACINLKIRILFIWISCINSGLFIEHLLASQDVVVVLGESMSFIPNILKQLSRR